MFEEDSYESLHQSERLPIYETDKQRNQRIRKNKNIRKEKVFMKRNQILESDYQDRKQLTREQRKQLQKQKNRIAAQNSRDKQKKYLQDLEAKVNEMEKQLQSQLCRKCRGTLSENSTSEDQPHQESHSLHYQITTGAQTLQLQNTHSFINILKQQREFEELPFVRDDSRIDLEWGNIGKYFCLILVVVSVALLSSSVESTSMGVARPVARILTENHEICRKTSEPLPPAMSKNMSPAMIQTLQNQKMKDWPFKIGSIESQDKCKNTFWEHYLGQVKTQVSNSYDWNLVTCNNPNLVHVATVYDRNINHLEDKWTFLITNPIVSQVLIQNNGAGNYKLDEVNYLDGVYQLTAEKVVFKKVMGQSCLN